MKIGKKGMEGGVLFLILAVVAIFFLAQNQGAFSTTPAPSGGTVGTAPSADAICAESKQTMTLGRLQDVLATTTSVTGQNATVVTGFKGSIDSTTTSIDRGSLSARTVADGGTLNDFGTKASILLLYALNGSTYVPQVDIIENTGCNSFLSGDIGKFNGNQIKQQDNTPLYTIFTGDTGTINSGTGNVSYEGIPSGDNGKWEVREEISDNTVFGYNNLNTENNQRGDILVTCFFNDSEFDMGTITIIGAKNFRNAPTPKFTTAEARPKFEKKAFLVEGSGNDNPFQQEYTVYAAADTGVNPVTGDAYCRTDALAWIQDRNLNGKYIYAVEDSTGTHLTGFTNGSMLFHYD